jgi:predicted nucleic acid-binding protein
MIADTTFLIQFLREGAEGGEGPARAFFKRNRMELIRTSAISIGEVAVAFPTSAEAWEYFKKWRIYPLHRGIVEAAADVDRQLISTGQRLGENDNWIAGFCRYYREPVISLDRAFDRVPRLRRLEY